MQNNTMAGFASNFKSEFRLFHSDMRRIVKISKDSGQNGLDGNEASTKFIETNL